MWHKKKLTAKYGSLNAWCVRHGKNSQTYETRKKSKTTSTDSHQFFACSRADLVNEKKNLTNFFRFIWKKKNVEKILRLVGLACWLSCQYIHCCLFFVHFLWCMRMQHEKILYVLNTFGIKWAIVCNNNNQLTRSSQPHQRMYRKKWLHDEICAEHGLEWTSKRRPYLFLDELKSLT